MASQAFMTDPAQLESLEGQQYLVLRPARDVAAFYESERAVMRDRLPLTTSSPNTGHVTLRGFSEPGRVEELKSALAAWARAQEPIELQVDAVDGFAPPFSVLIARLRRSASLVDAYARLSAVLDDTDLQRIGELPLEQWVFHLSLAYCGSLDESEWEAAHAHSRRVVADHPREVLSHAEFVWYESGIEHAEVLQFGGLSRPAAR